MLAFHPMAAVGGPSTSTIDQVREHELQPMPTADRKPEIIESFKRHNGDTGSSEVQIALLTDRITHLTDHLREHRHDFSTRRGLLKLVGRRRRELRYLSRTNVDRYHQLIQTLGLRR